MLVISVSLLLAALFLLGQIQLSLGACGSGNDCGGGVYCDVSGGSSIETCVDVGTGYYSPAGDNDRYVCGVYDTVGPLDATVYTTTGTTSSGVTDCLCVSGYGGSVDSGDGEVSCSICVNSGYTTQEGRIGCTACTTGYTGTGTGNSDSSGCNVCADGYYTPATDPATTIVADTSGCVAVPTSQPTSLPSAQPSTEPSGQPSSNPSGRPSSQPSSSPSAQPLSHPSGNPSSQPSSTPSSVPSTQPSAAPSAQPSSEPSSQPSARPSGIPSSQPSSNPSSQPSGEPSMQPSGAPSNQPSGQPSGNPSGQPSSQPSMAPSGQPTGQPSSEPTSPTGAPSSVPSGQPSIEPSGQPSGRPSSQPSTMPSGQPSSAPSMQPSSQPSTVPSALPSSQPSALPSGQPSGAPSMQPSAQPSMVPSGQPSSQPSMIPSSQPSTVPSAQPSSQPSMVPSGQPSSEPTSPSSQPTSSPSSQPSSQPSMVPSGQPSSQPSVLPSGQPSGAPSMQPSSQPSMVPSAQPSSQPSMVPSSQPSSFPSAQPSSQPSMVPSGQPSSQPTTPTGQPSGVPSGQPSSAPSSSIPSGQPSGVPSSQPSTQPSMQPSGQPSTVPSAQPSAQPSMQPSMQPSSVPSGQPSSQPSGIPSGQPSSVPSMQPSAQPSMVPSAQPSAQPSMQPSSQPSSVPSGQPSSQPTSPTGQPSSAPSGQPSGQPSSQPTNPTGQPTSVPSSQPSGAPSAQPSGLPSGNPSGQPSAQPSSQPSSMPSRQPTSQPSGQPSGQPTSQPTSPTGQPTSLPSAQPSTQPTSAPTGQPSSTPTMVPSGQPTSMPSAQPIGAPTSLPTGQPTSNPTTSSPLPEGVRRTSFPSSTPTVRPTMIPTSTPTSPPTLSKETVLQDILDYANDAAREEYRFTGRPTPQPTPVPSMQIAEPSTPTSMPSTQPSVPTGQPSGVPSTQPSGQPTSAPSTPTSMPTSQPSVPTGQPSSAPSTQPSTQPSSTPSSQPSGQPSAQPSPTVQGRLYPTLYQSNRFDFLDIYQEMRLSTAIGTAKRNRDAIVEANLYNELLLENSNGTANVTALVKPSVLNYTDDELVVGGCSAWTSFWSSGSLTEHVYTQLPRKVTVYATTLSREYRVVSGEIHDRLSSEGDTSYDRFISNGDVLESKEISCYSEDAQNVYRSGDEYNDGNSNINGANSSALQFIMEQLTQTSTSGVSIEGVYCNGHRWHIYSCPYNSTVYNSDGSVSRALLKSAPAICIDCNDELLANLCFSSTSTLNKSNTSYISATTASGYSNPRYYRDQQLDDNQCLNNGMDAYYNTTSISYNASIIAPCSPSDCTMQRGVSLAQTMAVYFDTIYAAPAFTVTKNASTTDSISITANLSVPGTLYCMGKVMNSNNLEGRVTTAMQSDWPQSIGEMMLDGTLSSGIATQFDNYDNFMNKNSTYYTVAVTIDNLLPYEYYQLYCYSTSETQEVMDYIVAMQTSLAQLPLPIRTACCKSISVSIENSNVYSSSSSLTRGPDISVSISSVPSYGNDMTISFALRSVDGQWSNNSLVPSSISLYYNTSAADMQVSLSVRAQTLASGDYNVLYSMTGSAVEEYSVSFTPNPVSRINILTSDATPDTPRLLLVRFADDLTHIHAFFSSDTDMASHKIGMSFQCYQLFETTDISNSSCVWSSARTLDIYPTTTTNGNNNGENVVLNSTLILRESILRAHCSTTATECASWNTSTRVTRYVQPALMPASPAVSISSAEILGACSSLPFDYSASTGHGGRPWTSIEYSMRSNPVNSTQDSLIEAWLNSSYTANPPSDIPSLYFTSGKAYIFTLTLCNFLHDCSSGTHTTTTLTAHIPSASMVGGQVRRVYRDRALSIIAQASISTCDGNGEVVTLHSYETTDLVYTWEVRRDGVVDSSSDSLVALARSMSRNDMRFSLPVYSLQADTSYELVLTVASSSHQTSYESVSTLQVLQGELMANISGASTQHVFVDSDETSANYLLLDALLSSDTDIDPTSTNLTLFNQALASYTFAWGCRRILPSVSDSCSVDMTVSSDTPYYNIIRALTAGSSGSTSRITLTLTQVSTDRSSTAYVDIVVVEQGQPRLTLAALSDTYMNSHDRLKLHGLVTLTGSSINDSTTTTTVAAFNWTVDSDFDIDLSDTTITPSSSTFRRTLSTQQQSSVFFVLNRGVLPAGISLTFTLSVSTFTGNTIEQSRVTITTNSPPVTGSITISPTQGQEWTTSFTYAAAQWSDDDLPLTYQFYYVEPLQQRELLYLGGSHNEKTYLQTQLPASVSSTSSASSRNMTCGVKVTDGLGAVTYANESASRYQNGIYVAPLSYTTSLDVHTYISRQVMNFTTLSSKEDTNTVLATLSTASTIINAQVDCSLAPDCARYNREGCSSVDNTCGACLAGYTGNVKAAVANSMCVTTTSLSNAAGSVSTAGGTYASLYRVQDSGVSCTIGNNESCLGVSPWHNCTLTGSSNDASCQLISKMCVYDCNGHGQCTFSDTNTALVLSHCYEGDVTCIASCQCSDGYTGAGCFVSDGDMAIKQTTRAYMVDSLSFLLQTQDTDRESVLNGISLLHHIMSKPDELSLQSYADILNISTTLVDSAITYGSTVDELSQLLDVMDTVLNQQAVLDAYQSNATATESNSTIASINILMDQIGSALVGEMVTDQSKEILLYNNMRLSAHRFTYTANSSYSLSAPLMDSEMYSGAVAPSLSFITNSSSSTASSTASGSGGGVTIGDLAVTLSSLEPRLLLAFSNRTNSSALLADKIQSSALTSTSVMAGLDDPASNALGTDGSIVGINTVISSALKLRMNCDESFMNQVVIFSLPHAYKQGFNMSADIPSNRNFTLDCDKDEFKSASYYCPNTDETITATCDGTKRVITSYCPIVALRPQCSLIDSITGAALQYDSDYNCTVVSDSSDEIQTTCACSVCHNSASSRRLNANKRRLLSSSSREDLTITALAEYTILSDTDTIDTFPPGYSTADDNPQVLFIYLTYAFIWLAIPLLLTIDRYRTYRQAVYERNQAQQSEIDKMEEIKQAEKERKGNNGAKESQKDKSNRMKLLGKGARAGNGDKRSFGKMGSIAGFDDDDSSLKGGEESKHGDDPFEDKKPKVYTPGERHRLMVDQFFTYVLTFVPPVFNNNVPWLSRFYNEMMKRHRYILLVRDDNLLTRCIRILHFLTSVATMFWLCALVLYLQYPSDTGQCSGLTTQDSCLALTGYLNLDRDLTSTCEWTQSGFYQYCTYREYSYNYQILILLLVMMLMLYAPLDMLLRTAFEGVLLVPTARDVDIQSNQWIVNIARRLSTQAHNFTVNTVRRASQVMENLQQTMGNKSRRRVHPGDGSQHPSRVKVPLREHSSIKVFQYYIVPSVQTNDSKYDLDSALESNILAQAQLRFARANCKEYDTFLTSLVLSGDLDNRRKMVTIDEAGGSSIVNGNAITGGSRRTGVTNITDAVDQRSMQFYKRQSLDEFRNKASIIGRLRKIFLYADVAQRKRVIAEQTAMRWNQFRLAILRFRNTLRVKEDCAYFDGLWHLQMFKERNQSTGQVFFYSPRGGGAKKNSVAPSPFPSINDVNDSNGNSNTSAMGAQGGHIPVSMKYSFAHYTQQKLQQEIKDVYVDAVTAVSHVRSLPARMRGPEVMRYFLLDLLGRNNRYADIFRNLMYDGIEFVVVTTLLKALVTSLLCIWIIYINSSIFSMSFGQSTHWQFTWAGLAILLVIIEYGLTETMEIFVLRIMVPSVAFQRIQEMKVVLHETIIRMFSQNMDVRDKYKSKEAYLDAQFSSTDYFFVSTYIARDLPELEESSYVLSYRAPLPGAHAQKWNDGMDKSSSIDTRLKVDVMAEYLIALKRSRDFQHCASISLDDSYFDKQMYIFPDEDYIVDESDFAARFPREDPRSLEAMAFRRWQNFYANVSRWVWYVVTIFPYWLLCFGAMQPAYQKFAVKCSQPFIAASVGYLLYLAIEDEASFITSILVITALLVLIYARYRFISNRHQERLKMTREALQPTSEADIHLTDSTKSSRSSRTSGMYSNNNNRSRRRSSLAALNGMLPGSINSKGRYNTTAVLENHPANRVIQRRRSIIMQTKSQETDRDYLSAFESFQGSGYTGKGTKGRRGSSSRRKSSLHLRRMSQHNKSNNKEKSTASHNVDDEEWSDTNSSVSTASSSDDSSSISVHSSSISWHSSDEISSDDGDELMDEEALQEKKSIKMAAKKLELELVGHGRIDELLLQSRAHTDIMKKKYTFLDEEEKGDVDIEAGIDREQGDGEVDNKVVIGGDRRASRTDMLTGDDNDDNDDDHDTPNKDRDGEDSDKSISSRERRAILSKPRKLHFRKFLKKKLHRKHQSDDISESNDNSDNSSNKSNESVDMSKMSKKEKDKYKAAKRKETEKAKLRKEAVDAEMREIDESQHEKWLQIHSTMKSSQAAVVPVFTLPARPQHEMSVKHQNSSHYSDIESLHSELQRRQKVDLRRMGKGRPPKYYDPNQSRRQSIEGDIENGLDGDGNVSNGSEEEEKEEGYSRKHPSASAFIQTAQRLGYSPATSPLRPDSQLFSTGIIGSKVPMAEGMKLPIHMRSHHHHAKDYRYNRAGEDDASSEDSLGDPKKAAYAKHDIRHEYDSDGELVNVHIDGINNDADTSDEDIVSIRKAQQTLHLQSDTYMNNVNLQAKEKREETEKRRKEGEYVKEDAQKEYEKLFLSGENSMEVKSEYEISLEELEQFVDV